MSRSERESEIAAAYRRCEAISRQSNSSFLAAFWTFPKEQRLALYAIYAFCRLADDIADDPRVRGDRRKLIAGWRGVLDDAFVGKSTHPVGIALGRSAETFQLRHEWFRDFIDGIEFDLDGGTIKSFDDLELYCYRVASTIGLLVVSVRGLYSPATYEYAKNVGIAVQLTNILRDVGEDARAGRVYLAESDMQKMGVKATDLVGDELSEELRVLMAMYAERARIRYERGDQFLPTELRRQARPAQAISAIYRELLDRLQREGFPTLNRVVRQSRPRRIWIAAQVWLGLGIRH